MFLEIFLFEIRQGFKKPSTYIFFSIFFLLTLLVGMAVAGYFDVATADTNVIGNSPAAVAGILVGMNEDVLGLVNSVILVAIMATAIQRDYEYNTHPFFFTRPISKASYFFGRFLGAFTIGLFVFFGFVAGYLTGCLFGMDTPLMGPFRLTSFLMPFLIFTVPNLLLLGSIFFSLTTFTRSTLSAYLFCIILLVIRIITTQVTADIDNKTIAAILEPFGAQAFQNITEYWTPDEQNSRMIPLSGVLLQNRVLWTAIALVITLISFYRFRFSQFLVPVSFFKRKNDNNRPLRQETTIHSLASLPKVRQDFSGKAAWRQLGYLTLFEFRKMAKSTFFIIICALGMVMMFIIAQYMGSMYETSTYPVTYQILESVTGIFHFFILILIVFFSGTVIWREREQKTDELIGATPVSNILLFGSKYLGLLCIIGLLLFVAMLTGIIIQLSKGFTDIQLLQYVQELFGRRLLSMAIITGLCLAVQVYTPNKYLGFFLALIPILFTSIIFSLLEWNNPLYHFNSSGPSLPYSDMNGYGHVVGSFLLFKTYWISIVLLLTLPALVLLARGKEKSWKARFRLSREMTTPGYKLVFALCLLIALGTGGYIHYNIKVLNSYKAPKQWEKETAQFEKQYKQLETIPQLRIVDVKVDAAIYPEKRTLHVSGAYILKNKRQVPIDTLVINYLGGEKSVYSFPEMQPDVPAELVLDDVLMGVRIYRLHTPVQPGDSISMTFQMNYVPRGFSTSTGTSIVGNGSFFNNMLFPSIGYNANAELSANTARKKYGLPPKPRMASIDDSLARMNNYISSDADWVRFEATVSTSGDQIAIAPGYLIREWQEDGRNHFLYRMDSPILHFYAFLSAAYEVKRDKWNDVLIEIYYHKGHEYNLDRMIKSIKKSLAYFTENFSPYQHRQARIIEFPRYASFAQSFPNTIPYSESVGFIAHVEEDNPDKIDVPFYVTAHEIAHQWWAHQVIGGNVQGSVLMSETMSQYAALMVMEKEYGKSAMKKFLRYEMDDYLRGRTFERKKEVPLMLCENQGYIHYNKGSVIMYSLRDYLGEDVLNSAVRGYLQQTAFQEPPYTNAIEFVDHLRAATPDSLQYLIHDMFETITLYENYVSALSYEESADGRYAVTLTVGSAKFRADSLGKQHRVPVADYMDVGIFGESNVQGKKQAQELVLQRVKMDEPEKTFTFMVTQKPVSAGIDPYHKLIDRTPDNNNCRFGATPPKVSLDTVENKLHHISISTSE